MELTEEIVRRRAQQYDVEMVHHAQLSGLGLTKLGNGLSRCTFLMVLDLKQNQLTSLYGIEAVSETLTVLNASENYIADISSLKECTKLTTLYLEGNDLASPAAVQPLTYLVALRDVFFQRRVPLEGEKEGLLLNNPFCSDPAVYKKIVAELLAHVLWVDGVMLRREDPLLGRVVPSNPLDDTLASKSLQNLSVISEGMRSSPGEDAFHAMCMDSSRAIRQSTK